MAKTRRSSIEIKDVATKQAAMFTVVDWDDKDLRAGEELTFPSARNGPAIGHRNDACSGRRSRCPRYSECTHCGTRDPPCMMRLLNLGQQAVLNI
jgi:hypothetical protein